jgi:hypothetical protein
MARSSIVHSLAAWAMTAVLSASGCGSKPPGGLEDYQTRVLSAEQALKEQGATMKQRPFAMNQLAWSVDLSGKEIKPEMLEAMQKIDGVGELNLKESKITDEQLQSLANVSPLYILNLSNTGITDAGLKHLTHKTIAELDVSGTKVTDEAVAALKKRYSTDPGINVFFKNIKIKR